MEVASNLNVTANDEEFVFTSKLLVTFKTRKSSVVTEHKQLGELVPNVELATLII